MGIIRLTLITAVLIWLGMLYFGRDEGLPDQVIGRAPQPETRQLTTPPAPAPAESDTAQTEPANTTPAPEQEVAQDEPAPAPEPTPTEPDPQPAQDDTAVVAEPTPEPDPEPAAPRDAAVDNAIADALATPEPAPEAPATEPDTTANLTPPASDTGGEFVTLPEPDRLLYVTGSRVNVRSGPSTVYDVITALPEGAAVTDLGDAGEGWRMIQLDTGETAYMSGDFLSPDAP